MFSGERHTLLLGARLEPSMTAKEERHTFYFLLRVLLRGGSLYILTQIFELKVRLGLNLKWVTSICLWAPAPGVMVGEGPYFLLGIHVSDCWNCVDADPPTVRTLERRSLRIHSKLDVRLGYPLNLNQVTSTSRWAPADLRNTISTIGGGDGGIPCIGHASGFSVKKACGWIQRQNGWIQIRPQSVLWYADLWEIFLNWMFGCVILQIWSRLLTDLADLRPQE